jgi:hypothetical protein
MAEYAWGQHPTKAKKVPVAAAADNPMAVDPNTAPPAATGASSTTTAPPATTPAPPPVTTPAPEAAPSSYTTPAPPPAPKSFYEALSAAKPPSMSAGLADQAHTALSELLTPKPGPSAGTERALSDFDKQAQEAKRQGLEMSALSGRAGTGQVPGDARLISQELMGQRADLSGSLAAQDEKARAEQQQAALGIFNQESQFDRQLTAQEQESLRNFTETTRQFDLSQGQSKELFERQLESSERLEAARLLQSNEQFQKQFGLDKEQLELSKQQIATQTEQAAAALGLSREQFAYAKKDAEFNRSLDTANLLISAYGDNPETALQAAEIMFQAFGSVGYMSQDQVQAGVLNAAADTFKSPAEFKAYAATRGAPTAIVDSIVAANSVAGGVWGPPGVKPPGSVEGPTAQSASLGVEFLEGLDPKTIKAGTNIFELSSILERNAAGTWDVDNVNFSTFARGINPDYLQSSNPKTKDYFQAKNEFKQPLLDAYMLDGFVKGGLSQADAERAATIALGSARVEAAKKIRGGK